LISTDLGLSDEDEVRILDHHYEGLWSELTGEAMKYEHEDYEISRFVGEMLRHANCYRRFPMNAMGYSPYNEVLSITIGSLANKTRIEKASWGFPMQLPRFSTRTEVAVHNYREATTWGVGTQPLDTLDDTGY
jgi:hypothetical protein